MLGELQNECLQRAYGFPPAAFTDEQTVAANKGVLQRVKPMNQGMFRKILDSCTDEPQPELPTDYNITTRRGRNEYLEAKTKAYALRATEIVDFNKYQDKMEAILKKIVAHMKTECLIKH